MRILQVYKDVHPIVRGGIERYVHDLSSYLVSQGHEVTVLVASDALRKCGVSEVSGIHLEGYPAMGRILSTPISPGLTRRLSRVKADIVHFHVPLPTAVMSWLRSGNRTPYVVTYHSDIVRQAFLLPFYGPFLKRFLEGASKVIATSPAYVSSSKWLSGLDNVEAVPIGVDMKSFTPGEAGTSDLPGGYYLFVGRFRSYKGIHVMLAAWRTFPERPLVMAGGGPLARRILREVRDKGLNITLVEDPEDETLVDLYRGARALLLPSIHRSEAFGMVQVEAMACGTPVISTDLPTGVPWVNRDSVSGFVVPPGDPSALARAVEMMEDDDTRLKLSSGALRRASENFNGPALFSCVESILRDAAEGGFRHGP